MTGLTEIHSAYPQMFLPPLLLMPISVVRERLVFGFFQLTLIGEIEILPGQR